MTDKLSIPQSYARWWKRLSASERAQLIDAKLVNPDDLIGLKAFDRSRVNDGHHDFSRHKDEQDGSKAGRSLTKAISSPSAADTVVANEDSILAHLDERLANLDLAGLRLRATLAYLLEGLDGSTDPAMRLHADIIRIVVGEGMPPKMTELANRHGITRAAVSLRCRKLLSSLGIEPSRFMRPTDEVESMKIAYSRRKTAFFVDEVGRGTPGKESITKRAKKVTQSRPPEILTKTGQNARPHPKTRRRNSK